MKRHKVCTSKWAFSNIAIFDLYLVFSCTVTFIHLAEAPWYTSPASLLLPLHQWNTESRTLNLANPKGLPIARNWNSFQIKLTLLQCVSLSGKTPAPQSSSNDKVTATKCWSTAIPSYPHSKPHTVCCCILHIQSRQTCTQQKWDFPHTHDNTVHTTQHWPQEK